MEAKQSSTDTAIKVIGAIFGTAHFILQTAADLTAESEGILVEKVSKGAITRQQAVDNRKNQTQLLQLKAKAKIADIKAKAQAKQQSMSNTQTPVTNEQQG